jgi:hypothetical protein
MNWIAFIGGVIGGFLLAGVVGYLLWPRVGYSNIRIRRTSPLAVKSVVELQPFVKQLIEAGSDQDGLYVRFENSRFLVRVKKRQFRRDPDIVEIEVRNSHKNSDYYAAVKSGFDSAGISYRERFTPKQKKPKDMRMRIDIGTLAPAAVGAVFKEIAGAVGEDDGGEILVSSHDPVFWRTAT